jgi:hypothetical protein
MMEFDGAQNDERVIIVPVEGLNLFTMQQIKRCPQHWISIMTSPNITLLRPIMLSNILIPNREDPSEAIIKSVSRKPLRRCLLSASMDTGTITINLTNPNQDDLSVILGV